MMDRLNNSYYKLTSLFHQDGKGSVSWWLNSYKVNIMINIRVAITRASNHETSHEMDEFRIHSSFQVLSLFYLFSIAGLISLFSVVHFKNKECTATSGLTGTCYSSTDCSDNGGTASGNCAAGFGVCCVVKWVWICCIRYMQQYLRENGLPRLFT